jgi:hypothetical protein
MSVNPDSIIMPFPDDRNLSFVSFQRKVVFIPTEFKVLTDLN